MLEENELKIIKFHEEGLSVQEMAEEMDIKEKTIYRKLKRLKDMEVIKDDKKFDEMSVMAFNDPSTGGNPTQLSDKDFLQLYKDAYNGIL